MSTTTLDVADFDRDSLHTLPLSIIPLDTPGLRRARLIKNAKLEGVVEMFHDQKSGSGQISTEDLWREFGWSSKRTNPDDERISALGNLLTYDVYSLRILLREMKIPVNDYTALKLSKRKNRELTEYMRVFIGPLIIAIYGNDQVEIRTFEDIIKLFRDPNVTEALTKLKKLATTLGVGLEEVPKFLEDYGDIFLSLAYFRQCLDVIDPKIDGFVEFMYEVRDNWQLKEDQNYWKACDSMKEDLLKLRKITRRRLDEFDDRTETMWESISADHFREVEQMIKNHHTSIGGVLCGLSVKMDAWERNFPQKDSGSPLKRSEFVLTQMQTGMERIKRNADLSGIVLDD